MRKFFKFKKKIQNWKNRDLTFEGKKLLLNSYILSSISYLSDIYTEHVPSKFVKETKELIRDFLFNGKTWRISQKNLGLSKPHGGIILKDLDNYIECKRLKWIMKIHFSPECKWNAYGKHYLTCLDQAYGVENFLLQCTSLKGINIKLPSFYQLCIQAWTACLGKQSVVITKEDVLQQNIFGNASVCYKKQSIFYPNWSKSDILTVFDIWDPHRNNWKQGNVIFDILKIKRNWIAEYNKIKVCIPKAWKQILVDNGHLANEPKSILCLKNVKLNHDNIKINNIDVNYKKVKEKDLYHLCLYPIELPQCVNAWKRILQCELKIVDVFSNCNHIIYHRKGLDFHWKTLHRSIYSEEKLRIMHKSNGICKVCNTEPETICHLLFDCQNVKPLWLKINDLLISATGEDYQIKVKNVILGFDKNTITDSDDVRIIYNFVIIIVKWNIWKHRNNVKFGSTTVQNTEWLYKQITQSCSSEIEKICNSYKYNKCGVELKSYLCDIKDLL